METGLVLGRCEIPGSRVPLVLVSCFGRGGRRGPGGPSATPLPHHQCLTGPLFTVGTPLARGVTGVVPRSVDGSRRDGTELKCVGPVYRRLLFACVSLVTPGSPGRPSRVW